MGIAEKSAGEPGYASMAVDFLAVRDTLDWSLPPVWGLLTSTGETPLIPRRIAEFAHHTKFEWGRWDLESVTHVVTGPNSRIGLGQPVRAGAAQIYRNPTAFPRARIACHPYYSENEKTAIEALERLGPAARDRLIIEDPTRPLDSRTDVSGTARITIDLPEHVEVETETPAPAYLVLGDTFDPGWTATIDGQRAPIRPAWVAFRAVFVPGGRHTVVFHYCPAGFTTGLILTVVGSLAAFGMMAWPHRLAPLSPAHAVLAWRLNWPRWVLLAALAAVVVSCFGIDSAGRLSVSARWRGGFHPFTWGAGIDAMRTRPKP